MHRDHHVLGRRHRSEQANVLERAGHTTSGDRVRRHTEHGATVEIDEPVPPEHFKAVAQVIGYVMKLAGKFHAN